MNEGNYNSPRDKFQETLSRPVYPNYRRDLSPDVTRRAVFIIPIGAGEDHREHCDKLVSGCEGGSCAICERGAP